MGVYVTVAEVKAEGATADDAMIERRILKWEGLVERLTRNVFRQLSPGELTFDGNNMKVMFFNLALIEVTSVKINGATEAASPSSYRAFTGKAKPQDHRGNPRIELLDRESSIFTRSYDGTFRKGLDQKITAKWGFVEPDGSTPKPVKEAIIQLVIADLSNYAQQIQDNRGMFRQSETTDDHSVSWDTGSGISWAYIPREIRDMLAPYRAPMAIAAIDVGASMTSSGYRIHLFGEV